MGTIANVRKILLRSRIEKLRNHEGEAFVYDYGNIVCFKSYLYVCVKDGCWADSRQMISENGMMCERNGYAMSSNVEEELDDGDAVTCYCPE